MVKSHKRINFFTFIRADLPGRAGQPVLAALCVAAAVLVLSMWLAFTFLGAHYGRELENLRKTTGVIPLEREGDIPADSGFEDSVKIYAEEYVPLTDAFKDIFAAQPDDVEITGVAYSDKAVTLDCKSGRELCGADFAGLLRKSAVFSDVVYTGVAKTGESYSFSITVAIKGKEESPDEPDRQGA